MRRTALAAALLAAGPSPAPWCAGQGAAAPRLVRRQTLALPAPIGAWRVLDVDGDGASELITADLGGRVVARRADADGRFPETVEGGVALSHPERALLALAPRPEAAGGGLDLVVVEPDGVRHHALVDGAWAPAGEPVARGARNTLRFGRPTFAPLARDVNGDGRADLALPAGDGLDLWLAAAPDADGHRRFAYAAHLPLPIAHAQSARAELLTDVLSERLRVPRLDVEDVNGDGRADLIVREGERRAYHLQAADGSFPVAPDVALDLGIFRDTTPEAELAPGQTLVLGDEAEMRSADLTADGIPDHVIAHRRKVWVFPGGAGGPQFTQPSQILKTAEDVTTLALLELDDDGRPDLLIVKLVVPSIGALLIGMLAEWDVRITAAGYRNAGGGRFDTRPTMRADLALRLPPLADLLRRPEDVIASFEEAERSYRAAISGDFDGDGTGDVALVGEDAARIELWRTPSAAAGADAEPDGVWLRRLIFEDETGVFDLERLVELLSSYGERRTRRLTGGRTSDARIELNAEAGLPLVAALPADVDGDGRAEIVCGYEGAGGRLVIEVLALEPAGR